MPGQVRVQTSSQRVQPAAACVVRMTMNHRGNLDRRQVPALEQVWKPVSVEDAACQLGGGNSRGLVSLGVVLVFFVTIGEG
jgi:hypothetical protein